MSKSKLLLDVVGTLRSLADSLQAVAEAMEGNETAEATQAENSATAQRKQSLRQKQLRWSKCGLHWPIRASKVLRLVYGLCWKSTAHRNSAR